ncbi:indoleacetamide hydrolase [Rhizobium leguminosarum]|uniref:indoleacetamide hydrolase n=1 Tax=Rhizobium leguminosarum TaxID=384 RepID=UPI003ECFED1B
MDLTEISCATAANLIKVGDIKSEELVMALVDRNEQLSGLTAFVSIDADRAIEFARMADSMPTTGVRGPLHGVPLAFKDNINVKGFSNAAGTPALANFRPNSDAEVTRRLREAGAIPFGKNTMHELAYGATSNNPAFGVPRNPFLTSRVSGGSSGGSGCAVAARLVPASIGTDTGGSVRIPAALCGVWGFRPTSGRWPTQGIVPISRTRDTPGPVARTARDLALLDAVVTGSQWPIAQTPLAGIRIGVPRDGFWRGCDEEIVAICQATLSIFVQLGAEIIEVDTRLLLPHHHASSMAISLYEGREELGDFLKAEQLALTFEDVVSRIASPDVFSALEGHFDPEQAVSIDSYREAFDIHRPALIDAYRQVFLDGRLDVLAFPTCPIVAPAIGEDIDVNVNGQRMPTFQTLIRNTDPGSNAGLPGITMPVGLTKSGLPVGIALDAWSGNDDVLLRIAVGLDEQFPALKPDLSSLPIKTKTN